jgi:SAM-dependent methyltransferase
MCFETVEHLINRKLPIEFNDRENLRNTIKNYTDWRLPGMVIGARQEMLVEDMVPMDPLYLVDHNRELIDVAMSPFTREYQNRLRPYVINDWKDTEIFAALPTNQFGLVFAYNYFNWKPIEIIEKFLSEIYHKLRPGGALVFTYNECDNWYGVGAVENAWMCYTPGSRIQTIARNLGYKIIDQCTGAGDIAWFEMRRPGEIQSLRGGQVLARVIRRE